MRNEIEMMRVLRVPPMGKLVIEVGGNRIETLAEISNPKVKQRLLAAIGELIVVAGGYQELVNAGVAAPLAVSQQAAGGGEETAVSSVTDEQRDRFLRQLEAQRDAMKGSSKSAPTLTPSPSASLTAHAPEVTNQLSIVEQIDAMLQKYVAADPELASRSIHLKQNPAGGLRINVDGQYYERPREIDDPKIQIAIKQALKEWEST
ncbi:MAG: hypothetical protein R3E31_23810 [Chloroflexota bacterium]|nr:hypothetical protein [Ardenticatenaceae bacterium]